MWATFFMAVLFCSAVMYIPGYILLRAVGFAKPASIASAPLMSTGMISVWCVLLSRIHVFASPLTVLAPIVVFCLLLYVISALVRRKSDGSQGAALIDAWMPANWHTWRAMIAFAVVGVAVGTFVFLKNLDGPASFNQGYDNATHLTRITTFVLSGNYSSIDGDYRWDLGSLAPLNTSGGFYPSAWHDHAALACAAVSISAPMAENAVDFVVIALVYPLGVLGFLMTVLKDSDKPYVVAACGLPLAFAVFPWLLLRNVFPNILGFALVFSEMALFIEWVSLAESPRHFAMVLLLLFLGMAGLGLAHPNSVFTVGVLAAPFVTYLIGIACTKRFSGRAGFLAAVAFVMLACVIWYVAFRLPALGGIVSFKWPSFETPWQALRDIVLVGYRAAPIQLLLAAIVALGCVRALFVGSYRWMFFPFAVSAVMYFVNATSDGFFKSLLTGFWYTDSYRIAAMLAMFAVPMASIGMVLICQKVLDAIVSRLKTSAKDAHVLSICAAATILFCLANYYPALPSPGYSNTAFGFARSTIRWQNLQSRSDDLYLLTDEEREFVSLVLEVVPDGALVLNEPYDGSVYTYGAYGLNVYYRMFTEYGETPNESAASVLLREELPTVSTSDDVRELLNDLDAEYLLLLDAGGEDLTRQTMISFHEDAWAGIDGIGDDTPGFEVVLSEGDMRLYRISQHEGQQG